MDLNECFVKNCMLEDSVQFFVFDAAKGLAFLSKICYT